MPCFRLRAFVAALGCAAISACGGGGDGGGGGGGGGPLNITTTAASDGVIGAAYSQTVAATGGSGGRTFSISAGTLPAGLSLSVAGAVTGTPTGPAGTSSFTVQVTDSVSTPATDTQALSIDIVEPLAITTAALSDTSVGDVYAAAITATGGTAPYTFSISGGALPDGIEIGADGSLSGTVALTATTETFTVEVADSSLPQLTAAQEHTVRVTLEVATSALAEATGGVEYSDGLRARGGLPPFNWSLTAGALPAGLTGPDAAGVISGTPDAVCATASTSLAVQVVDSDTPAMTANRAGIDLTVSPATLDFRTAVLPNGRVNLAYDQRIVVTGGVPPYSFAVTFGNLPSQLSLSANDGRITGTPDTVETQAFEVTVTDACPTTASQHLTLVIDVASPGRNDSIATATALPGNGTYMASISPSGQPNSVLDPDEDYYEITTTASSTVTIDTIAQDNGSPVDTVIEIVNAAGTVLNRCGDLFNQACVNDDEIPGSLLDSRLQLSVTGATTFYIHVVDWGSNARPDMLYELVISGVN